MRALSALLLVGGCMWQSADPPPLSASHVEEFEWPGMRPPKMDVLFVLDDSAAMAPYLDRTAAMLHAVEALWPDVGFNAMPDLHVAVTTADPADGGRLHLAPGVHGAFLIDEHRPDLSGGRTRDYDGGLGDAIAALGAVGTAGGGPEPLVAARAAIESTPGFLRGDAYLAIVIVSASDDASPVAIADAVGWAKGLKPDPAAVVVAGVFPASAMRLASFVASFPNRGEAVAIAAADYTPAIELLAQIYTIELGVPCLDEPMDVDPVTPGAQLDCTIELVGEDGSTEVEPPCPGERCWTYRPDPMNCIESPGGRIDVTPFRWPVMPTIQGQCVVAN